ncbi:MAG TPA: DNA primase [Gemmatimonadales bacterium]|nr:DNA primase [Gemmatimonadales bacterium]
MIPPDLIDQIREAADMVQLIGEHVDLKRTGSDWRGPCPFHGGKGRNFSVVPRKQLYHCFVCHESGDIFKFWMSRFGLDYPSAVREIAGRVGIAVPEQRQQGPDPNEPLYSALGVAAEWFAQRLREGEDARIARDYLDSRAIGQEARDSFGLGFAPRGTEALDAFRGLGLEDDVLVEAGLAVRRDDGAVAPRFRGRLLFPIADVRGRVVGFGGRILGEGEPKYLNSPETPVFHKGSLLYLLDRARGAIRQEESAIVVEGYVDAIRLHLAGIANVVAPLGTALTAEQSKVLRRYTRQVALCYDADAPGLKSTFRAGDELLRQGVNVSVITLPPGEDPDTLVRSGGAAAFREYLAQAVDVFERKIQILDRKGYFATLEGRRRALDRLLPTIRAAADAVTRELYVSRAAEKSGVSRAVIEQEVGRREGGRLAGGGAAPPKLPPSRPGAVPPEILQERILLRLMRADPIWVRRAQAEIEPALFQHAWYRAMAEALFAGSSEPPDPSLTELWERLPEELPEDLDREAAWSEAVQFLKDRPRIERLEQLESQMRVAVTAEEKERLVAEITALRAVLPARFRRKALRAEMEPI